MSCAPQFYTHSESVDFPRKITGSSIKDWRQSSCVCGSTSQSSYPASRNEFWPFDPCIILLYSSYHRILNLKMDRLKNLSSAVTVHTFYELRGSAAIFTLFNHNSMPGICTRIKIRIKIRCLYRFSSQINLKGLAGNEIPPAGGNGHMLKQCNTRTGINNMATMVQMIKAMIILSPPEECYL